LLPSVAAGRPAAPAIAVTVDPGRQRGIGGKAYIGYVVMAPDYRLRDNGGG
jgi:hypothetical protein